MLVDVDDRVEDDEWEYLALHRPCHLDLSSMTFLLWPERFKVHGGKRPWSFQHQYIQR